MLREMLKDILEILNVLLTKILKTRGSQRCVYHILNKTVGNREILIWKWPDDDYCIIYGKEGVWTIKK